MWWAASGCMDDGVPGMALYAMLYLSPGRVDAASPASPGMIPSALKQLFIRSGFAEACPIMAHVTCLQQQRNFDFLDALRHPGAQALAAEKHEAEVSPRNMDTGRRDVSLAGRPIHRPVLARTPPAYSRA